MNKIFNLMLIMLFFIPVGMTAQQQVNDSINIFKKRVLETTEVDFLASYYSQDGDNAAVSGGIGSEELTDIAPTIIVSVPLNDDDVLAVELGVSAYTSASSSNIDPFDGDGPADPFQASSGASQSDLWVNITGSYSHSSDDRNSIWSGKVSISSEYDYFSAGVGGSYSRLFNEKNSELTISSNIYIDTWNAIYPIELRPFGEGGDGINNTLFTQNTITGNADYNPNFTEFQDEGRNSYSLGVGFSQILSKNLQGSLSLDIVQQDGLLSTPFQRVYFGDIADSFIENFQLADDIERLPDTRFKIALGGRLNYYINETFVLRSYYRYYTDDFGIQSHTASIEVPIKITDRFTLYPSYRYYRQTASDYFAPAEQNLSTQEFYTSDFDLSEYIANQFGFGIRYTDIFAKAHIWKLGIKSIDLKFNNYERDSGLQSNLISFGIGFVMD